MIPCNIILNVNPVLLQKTKFREKERLLLKVILLVGTRRVNWLFSEVLFVSDWIKYRGTL